MHVCFVFLLCTNFAIWTITRAEFGIFSNKDVSYLWMEFPSVAEAYFPRNLTVNISITDTAGPFLYSIDRNGNQLFVELSQQNMELFVQLFGRPQQKFLLRQLCSCKVCLYIPLLLEMGLANSTFWARCNGGNLLKMQFNSSNPQILKNFPTLKQRPSTVSQSANYADLYLLNYPGGSDQQQIKGCIFNIEYEGQPIGNKMKISGSDITKECKRSCTSDKCNGGVCHEKYNGETICDCTTAFGSHQNCSDGSRIINRNFNRSFLSFEGIKLSWRLGQPMFWQIGNKDLTQTVTVKVDHWGQLKIFRKGLQKNSIDEKFPPVRYVQNDSYVLILRSNQTIRFEKVKNVTVGYANYDVMNVWNMNISSCRGVIDVAQLQLDTDIEWKRIPLEIYSSVSHKPENCDPPKPNNALIGIVAIIPVPIIVVALIIWCLKNKGTTNNDTEVQSVPLENLSLMKNVTMEEGSVPQENVQQILIIEDEREHIVLHWKEASMICLRSPIVNGDIQKTVTQIQQNIQERVQNMWCLKRMMVFICYMPNSLSFIPSCMDTKRLFIEKKDTNIQEETNEYIVYPKDNLPNTMSIVKSLRDWELKYSSGNTICMTEPSNDQKWEEFSTIEMTVPHERDKDIFHVLVKNDISEGELKDALNKFVRLKQRMNVEKFIKSHNSKTQNPEQYKTQYKDEFNKLIMIHLPMEEFTCQQEPFLFTSKNLKFRNIEVAIEVQSTVKYIYKENIKDDVEFINEVLSQCSIFEKVIILQQCETDNGTCVVMHRDYCNCRSVSDICEHASEAKIKLLDEKNKELTNVMSVSKDYFKYAIVAEDSKPVSPDSKMDTND